MKTKAGLGVVILGVAVFGAWQAWTRTRNPVPIDVPLTLQGGKTLTTDFRLNLDGLYLIEIVADTNLPPETLQCLMGLQTSPAPCKGIVPAIAANWILFRDGQEVRRGSSSDLHSAPAETKTPTRVIGEFPGEADRSYRLRFFVIANGHQLDPANPRLRVAVSSLARTDFQSAGVLVFSISFICVFFGAVLLGIVWLAPRRHAE